ncbi:GNAT family N-acetyltransferase [Sporosarcina gallistercoris]|uniref:GNAT family N-acetyltransferase n=1 Tax=Sporosarcina gallistercoris TaxID=2762245 RepID=A0ABR8PIT6_9BACL|nr:GNAT family N-acetyltransferase [Sporosarcina gallistercoris]MBD7908090.1 GNAT family N-acetyltransferase [Sporosarcina gallistercoris]
MNLEIHDVTATNYRDILELKVAQSQKEYIETPYECLEESVEWKQFKPVGLYADGELVGFSMYGFFKGEGHNGRLWIDRLLIDERFQGRGLGTAFMRKLIETVSKEYGEQPIYLSVYPENEGAVRLYEKLGFKFIEERDVNGEHIMVRS